MTVVNARRAVVVIGSANADLSTDVDRRPLAGETIVARTTTRSPGGKGANQAAAAARAGAAVSFIGAVGADEFGREQCEALRQVGVDVSHTITIAEASTGTAFITVTPDGENSIVVALGANADLLANDVISRLECLSGASVVVIQTEVPLAIVDAVAAWCSPRGVRLVLNNGPYQSIARSTLQVADPLVVNEHEARLLCSHRGASAESLVQATFEESGARSVIVTFGSRGAEIYTADGSLTIPGVTVEAVVDTTGAGDAFVGTLAARLADGFTLAHAAADATEAAALSVTWFGARPSLVQRTA